VLVQLVPALVITVERREEGAGVAGVDLDRAMVLGTEIPERVELGVIDGHEPAVLIAVTEAERLMNLQALGAGLETALQPLDLAVGPAGVVDALEIDEGVGQEPAGVSAIERIKGLLQSLVPATIKVHHGADAGRVHLGEILGYTLGRQRRSTAEVVVNVDDRECRLLDLGLLDLEHRLGLPVAELQLAEIVGRSRLRSRRRRPAKRSLEQEGRGQESDHEEQGEHTAVHGRTP
jgi:hypothetical protein